MRQQIGIGDQCRAEILPLLQRVFLQQSLAKPVDREDRRLVELIERPLQGRLMLPQLARGPLQRLPHARLQLAGRLFRERDEQDLVQRRRCLGQEAQHELLDGVGLPRAGGSLDHCVT